MPTDVIKSIGSAGGRDYATPALWIAACPANLVTSDQRWIGECYNDSEFTGTGTRLSVSGITADSTRYVICKCATGQSFKDNANVRTNALVYTAANGVAIRATGAYSGLVVSVGVSYTQLIGLQMRNAGSAGDTSVYTNVANCRFDSCIIQSGSTAALGIDAANVVVVNTLLIRSNGASGGTIAATSASTLGVYGCTLVNVGTVGSSKGIVFNNYSTLSFQNNAVFGHSTAVSTTSSSSSSFNNATNLATGFGSANQTSLTFASQFQNSASDFRAIGSGSLDLNGTPDTTNIPTDISGTTRHATTPTIGCWEVVASSVFLPKSNLITNQSVQLASTW